MKTKSVSEFVVRVLEQKRNQARELHRSLLARMQRVLAPEGFARWRQAREEGRVTASAPCASLPELDWKPRRNAWAGRPAPQPGYFMTTFVFQRFDERQWN